MASRLGRLGWLVVSMSLALCLSSAHVASAQEGGLVVEGQVVNGTPDGGGVAGLTVTLHRHSALREDDLVAPADGEGRFRFENVPYDPELAYGVSVVYQGALYGTDLDLSGGGPAPVTLTVYEASGSDEVLSSPLVSVLIAQVERSSQSLWVLEIVKIVNSSHLTYVPGMEPMKLLRFGLPPGARELEVDTRLLGAEVIEVDRGFALTGSVPPGEHEVMFAYVFPYKGSAFSLQQSFPYGADVFRLVAPQDSMGMTSADLGASQVIDLDGRKYDLLGKSDLPRGSRLTIDLSGLPRASLGDRVKSGLGRIRLEYLAPIALGAMMAALVGLALWRRRARQMRPALVEAQGNPDAALDERRIIMEMIDQLERSLRLGEVTDSEYARRRAALGARLASLKTGADAG